MSISADDDKDVSAVCGDDGVVRRRCAGPCGKLSGRVNAQTGVCTWCTRRARYGGSGHSGAMAMPRPSKTDPAAHAAALTARRDRRLAFDAGVAAGTQPTGFVECEWCGHLATCEPDEDGDPACTFCRALSPLPPARAAVAPLPFGRNFAAPIDNLLRLSDYVARGAGGRGVVRRVALGAVVPRAAVDE